MIFEHGTQGVVKPDMELLNISRCLSRGADGDIRAFRQGLSEEEPKEQLQEKKES